MLNFITTVGYANAALNLTDDLSILLSGLIGLVWLSATMITVSALRESFSPKAKIESPTTKKVSEYRLAA